MRLKALLLSLLVSLSVFAQTDPRTLQFAVSGTVLDSGSGRALQYVVVTIPGTRYSTVTNSDGGFIIKSTSMPESLEFSLLGYKDAAVHVPEDGAPVTVRMEKNNLTLDEAIVVSGDPYSILEEAITRIKYNYPSVHELFDCFYRETVQKKHRYIFVSEAVSRMFKTSYRREGVESDRITIDKSRVLASPNKRDTLSVKVVGGPSQAVDLDIVKSGELLSRGELAKYRLAMGTPAMIGDRLQFAIQLIPAVETDYPLYTGTIYVDSESLAFTRFDLKLDMRDKDKVTRMILVKKPAGLRFEPTEVSIRYDYSLRDGVSRVSYVRTSMRFKCDWKRRLFKTDFTAISELVTTDRRESEGIPISRKESFGRHEALSDRPTGDFDPEFWKDYNIIEPTVSLDRAIVRIMRQSGGK